MILKHTFSCIIAVMSLTLVHAQSTDSDHTVNHNTIQQRETQKSHYNKETEAKVEDDQIEKLSTSDSIITIINAFKVFPNTLKNRPLIKSNAIEPKISLL